MSNKLLVWLGADYTHFCLSHVLQQKFDCDLYGVIDVTEKPKTFFEQQNLVNFKKTWFFHDQISKQQKKPNLEYLINFEEKFKINLWQLVLNERIFLYYDFHKFTYNEILSIVEQECRFFETILEVKPDFFLTKLPGFHHLELFYQMCRNVGIKVLMLNLSTFGQSCIITEDPGKLDIENYSNESSKTNFEELQKKLYENDLSKQIKNKVIKTGTDKSNILNSTIKYFFSSTQKTTQTHYPYYGRTKFNVLSYYLNFFLKTKNRKSFIDKQLKKEIPSDQPFVYFPLHIEIERATLITAPLFTNQIEIVKMISKSLPINFKLYVKEHPAQVTRGWRTKSDYQELLSIPNVELIHPDFSSKSLYEKCSLVITIAGSAGFEASFFGKPTITFSNLNYSILPFVYQIKNLNDLPIMIREALNSKVEPEVVANYIKLLEKNSSNFDWVDFTTKLKEEFFYGGNLVDVEISELKMQSFLKRHYSELEVLANDHIERINYFQND